METSANAVQEFLLLDALEGTALVFLLVQAGAAIRTLAALVRVLWPETVRGYLCQGEIAVDGPEAGLEDAVCEEKLDIELARDGASSTEADEATSLLKQLLQRVGGLLGRAAMLMSTKMESAHLEVAIKLVVVV